MFEYEVKFESPVDPLSQRVHFYKRCVSTPGDDGSRNDNFVLLHEDNRPIGGAKVPWKVHGPQVTEAWSSGHSRSVINPLSSGLKKVP